MRVRLCAVAVSALLFAAPAALADTTMSSNWGGYAVHRAGVAFRVVEAAWRQPRVKCIRGVRAFSSYWVGLGGYNPSSNTIEQIGTEVDCTRWGAMVSSAWYELLPAPSRPISLSIHPGDLMAAAVVVSGHRVAFTLRDITSQRQFSHVFRARSIDTSSAEWIVEAPSDCLTQTSCRTLPLADFGRTKFLGAAVQGSHGHWGGLTDPSWQLTRITLDPLGHRFQAGNRAVAAVGGAQVGPVSGSGRSFSVSYSALSGTGAPSLGLSGALRSGALRSATRAPAG